MKACVAAPVPREGDDVLRIAVIQDGTELVRQTDADVADCYERCCALLSADGTNFTSQTFTDDTVGNLLEHIDPDEHRCLVLASNALISERIEYALTRSAEQLRHYLAAGGGLIILHQLVDSLAGVLPDDLCPGLADRKSARSALRATAHDQDDLLLNYPERVALADYYDGDAAPGPPSLFYKALRTPSLPEKLMPVITYNDEILLARSYDHVPERIVIATMPLDWQCRVELLANAIRFACLGRPRRLIWRQTGAHEAVLVRWLSMDGGTSVRPVPDPGAIAPAERWLLRTVDVVFAPHSRLDAIRTEPEVRQFLTGGGTLMTHDQPPGDTASRVISVVGNYAERRLANRMYGELRAVRGWEAVDYAFELRNIVIALCLLWNDPANHSDVAVGPDELARLKPLLRERLTSPTHREDLSSSIALVQSLAFLSQPEPLDPRLYEWMSADPRRRRFDVGLQIRAVTALATRQPDPGFVTAAAAALGKQANLGSVAPVIRVLDTVAVLDQAGLLDCEPAAVRDLAELAAGYLDTQPADQAADGWLSVEATADAVRGLVVLLERLGSGEPALEERLADSLGQAMSVLRQSFGRYEANRKGVAWLAGLTHAVVTAQRLFPIGLQRLASLDWPERSDDDQQAIGTGLPLLEHLAVENKALRDRERQFDAERRAARAGRAAVTLGALALFAGPLAYAFVQLGFASVWGLAGNTVLLTALAGTLAFALTMLNRWNLLAQPAVRVLDWITANVPPLSRLGTHDR